MELLFELGINLLETFLIVEFMTRYLGCKYSGAKRNICFVVGWMIIFGELCIRNYFVELESISSFIPIVFYAVYCVISLKGSIFAKVWVSILIQIMVIIIAALTNLIVCNVIGYDPYSVITVFNGIRIICIILSKMLLFYFSRMILKIKHSNRLDNSTWLMIIVIPAISVLSLGFLMKAAVEYEEIKGYILIGMLSIIVSNIITYFFFYEMNKQHEAKIKIKILELQNENALKSIEDSKAFVSQMRKVKHDIKNQLIIIGTYISSGKYEEAQKHITSITGNYLPSSREYINTGFDAFDVIANVKSALCDTKGIFLEIRISGEISWHIEPVDMVVVLGNLLDNAIEASESTKIKHICVEVSNVGEYLSLLVTNNIEESVLKNNKNLETSKQDKEKHGIGLKSVKAVVEKYDGFLDFYESENKFRVRTMFSQQRKN